MRAITATVISAALAAGCYRTAYEMKPQAGLVRVGPEHFHLSLINIIEISAPIDLVASCGGVEEPTVIVERVGILGGIANIVLSSIVPILHVHNAHVDCAAGQPAPRPPPGP